MSRHWIDYLTSQGAQLSDGGYQVDFPSNQNSTAQLCVLSSQTIVEASGTDTLRFLQGQLTCNMDKLDPMQHTLGAACTPKGRMFASFTVANTSYNYLLRMHKDISAHFITNLGKYAVFYKSKLSMPPEAYLCLGLTGENAASELKHLWGTLPTSNNIQQADKSLLLKNPAIDSSYELWLPENHLPTVWEQLTQHFTPTSERTWSQQRIAAVVPEINSTNVEKYIPQHFNFPSLGYISFRKGCYTGQEIVARMQNLGQQKSRVCHITIKGIEKIAPGTRLINEQDKPAGEILETVTITDAKEHQALAVLKIEATNVFLEGQPESEITIHPTPYSIDPKAELQY